MRCAFWLGLLLMLRGEAARAGGWLAGAERLVEDAGRDGAGRGYLRVPVFLAALTAATARPRTRWRSEVVEVAQRCGDEDLLALGVLGQGQAALVLGELAARDGPAGRGHGARSRRRRVSPIVTGIVYCAVIEACMDAPTCAARPSGREALERWCAAQPDLVPYRGQCLVHRSQVLQARGHWPTRWPRRSRRCRALADPRAPGARARALPAGRAAPAAR